MLTQNQVNDLFNIYAGRSSTPQEYEQYKNAPISSFNKLRNFSENIQNSNVSANMSPYDVPTVNAAGQVVSNVQSEMGRANKTLEAIPQNVLEATKYGIVTNPQLNAQIKAEELPTISAIRNLKGDYSAARSTYTSVFSAAKQAISSAKAEARAEGTISSREKSRALTEAGKVIELLKSGRLDAAKVDLSQIEQASGLPQGFFSSITPSPLKPIKDTIRSLRGGLYDIDKNKWIIKPLPPKTPVTKTRAARTPSLSSIRAKNNEMVTQAFNNFKGANNYVSPDVWNKIKNHWINYGYGTALEFDRLFSNWADPSQSYWLSRTAKKTSSVPIFTLPESNQTQTSTSPY